ncbi:MAG TPA: 50S ribosomal protein L29 [bacterium]|jgi:large subunit ribosomal protein L29|nr:50S ribosomal protein L29 [bacterium]HPO11137.1 50S ribosomal protein L29 [bacterium]HPV55130.1 50S ribosomal protein L29 [Bacilli bacterium]
MKSKEFNKKIKDLSLKELKDNLAELSFDLVNTKFKVSLNDEKHNSKINELKKNIARINTELRRREISENKK